MLHIIFMCGMASRVTFLSVDYGSAGLDPVCAAFGFANDDDGEQRWVTAWLGSQLSCLSVGSSMCSVSPCYC